MRELAKNGADKPTRIRVETIKSTDKILLNFPSNMRDEALLMSGPWRGRAAKTLLITGFLRAQHFCDNL